jgi:hypothetical protein
LQLIRINGELAEIVPAGVGRAKLVYFACEPEGRLPTEVEYAGVDFRGLDGRQRIFLDPGVLRIERVEEDVTHPLNPRKLVLELAGEVPPQVTYGVSNRNGVRDEGPFFAAGGPSPSRRPGNERSIRMWRIGGLPRCPCPPWAVGDLLSGARAGYLGPRASATRPRTYGDPASRPPPANP